MYLQSELVDKKSRIMSHTSM